MPEQKLTFWEILGTGTYSESLIVTIGGTPTTTTPSGNYSYGLDESANAWAGVFTQSADRGRYGLLVYFTNVANTASGNTPGNMNFLPFGQAFVDPGPDGATPSGITSPTPQLNPGTVNIGNHGPTFVANGGAPAPVAPPLAAGTPYVSGIVPTGTQLPQGTFIEVGPLPDAPNQIGVCIPRGTRVGGPSAQVFTTVRLPSGETIQVRAASNWVVSQGGAHTVVPEVPPPAVQPVAARAPRPAGGRRLPRLPRLSVAIRFVGYASVIFTTATICYELYCYWQRAEENGTTMWDEINEDLENTFFLTPLGGINPHFRGEGRHGPMA